MIGSFQSRHIGPTSSEQEQMLEALGYDSMEAFMNACVPTAIQAEKQMSLKKFAQPLSEHEALVSLKEIANQNTEYRSYLGMGYAPTLTPTVIQRNILENPGWYTQYTPYQPEISQGRLEALLNFQTLISELTGLPVANASLLDEATACAEAMALAHSQHRGKRAVFLIDVDCHPQVKAVVKGRALPLNIEVREFRYDTFDCDDTVFGVLFQYPGSFGEVRELTDYINVAKQTKALSIVTSDLLALTLLKAPAEMGADIAVGTAQRFGIPLGYGGPHPAYFAVKEELKRKIPGRIVGMSVDVHGKPALRLALQTREQHIRREKATSNICTSQVLLAVMAGFYAVYHGSEGLKNIAQTIASYTADFAAKLSKGGYFVLNTNSFDTLTFESTNSSLSKVALVNALVEAKINVRIEGTLFSVTFDEQVTPAEYETLCKLFGLDVSAVDAEGIRLEDFLLRKDTILQQAVFNQYHTESEFLRYVKRLESRDLSLCTSMIPLGSCTMKLNATSEMVPVSWGNFSNVHPFAPVNQTKGYQTLFEDLEKALAEITGFDAVSLQPNAGSQGEYAGLSVIRAYHAKNDNAHRNICLIPTSAHGTNPASAVMVGMKVVPVKCDDQGNIDKQDLEAKCALHSDNLAALMVTYPSTHGVFESGIKDLTGLIHKHGGQVYMDGANLNALIGVVQLKELGMDVCHINLHKTFCIPHGGGGPGMGPIACAEHLAPYLPTHPAVDLHKEGILPISAAPWGSASILPITWMYIAMMGQKGLIEATQVAILNANYIANRLAPYYPVLYKGQNDRVAHECIVDLRPFKKSLGVEVDDVAKRLMDYGYHAPTMSFPVIGTMMIEPTESETKGEIDRFCDAMIAIHGEIEAVAKGDVAIEESVLRHAPHTVQTLSQEEWNKPYTRQEAIFPAPHLVDYKFWPTVGRINAAHGDRNLICTCGGVEEYA